VVFVAVMVVAGSVAALLATRDVQHQPPPADAGVAGGYAWMADPATGEAVQVDIATGRAVARLVVAAPGAGLRLVENDELLVAIDGTGTVTIVDAATSAIRGRFPGAGAAATVLLHGTEVYVADWARGTIVRLDAADARAVGTPWTAGIALVDAAVDGEGTVWALEAGLLHRLMWTSDGLVDATAPIRVSEAGTGTALVAHDRGVTIVSPAAGVAARVGTDADTTITFPVVPNAAQRPAHSPADLVPVTLTGSRTLLLITGSGMRLVDLTPYGCDQPLVPEVAAGMAWVPCRGVGRVIAVDSSGQYVPPALALGTGDPILVALHDGLFATVSGADRGAIVGADGVTGPLVLRDQSQPLPASLPTIAALPTVAAPPPPTTGQPAAQPPPGSKPKPQKQQDPPKPPATPSGVKAQAIDDGTVKVSWTPADGVDEYVVRTSDGTATVVNSGIPGNAVSATITGLALGITVRSVVEAHSAAGRAASDPSNPVTVVKKGPGSADNVTITPTVNATSLTVSVNWTIIPGGQTTTGCGGSQGYCFGPVTGFTVTVTTDKGTTAQSSDGYWATSAGPYTLACNGTCSGVTITATIEFWYSIYTYKSLTDLAVVSYKVP
jgi:hypothetical protein